MTFDAFNFVNLEIDTVALLILLGLIMIPKSSDEKKNTGTRLFSYMGLCIVIGVVADLLFDMYSSSDPYGWGSAGLMISCIVLELSVTALLFLFFIYTDYELYESRDYLKRHMIPYVVPVILFAVICLLLPLIRKDNGFQGQDIMEMIVFLTEYLALIYLFLTGVHLVRYYRRFGEKRFFHPLSIYVPILCGALFTFFTLFTGVFLGFSLGLLFLVFSKIDSYRFQDTEYMLYNEHYLRYILDLVESGKEDLKSIILFTAKGDALALSKILKHELPAKSEVISLGGGDFLYLSKLENPVELEALSALILDAAEEYDEDHEDGRIDLEVSSRIFDDFKEMKEALLPEG